LKDLNSLEHRVNQAKASTLAGLAFSQTRTAAAHSLSYPLTLFHQIPHGYACSLTLGAMFEFNEPALQEELQEVQNILGRHYDANSFEEGFQHFLNDCEVPNKLRDFGVTKKDIPNLVKNAFHPDRFENMVYKLTEKEVQSIYQSVL
jgi:alcohol dehydrogenase